MGQRVADIREKAGLTQTQLGKKIGVSQRVIANWERKPVALRAEQLAALAEALGVSADYLLGRPDAKPPAPKGPPGKLRQAFDLAYRLPRHEQNKIVEFVEAYASHYAAKAS